MTENEIRQALAAYQFYHAIQVTEDIRTTGWTAPGLLACQEMTLSVMRSLDLKGKRVLDIGCRDGLFSFAAEQQGASEVIGIDRAISRGAVEFLIPFFKSRVQMHELSLYDLTAERFGLFDVVLCPGVLYHLRFPFWGLKRISEVLSPGGQLVLETAVLIDSNRQPLLFCPVGEESPYEATSCTFFNTKGLTDTLKSFGLPVDHVTYLHDRQPLRRRLARLGKQLRSYVGLRVHEIIDRATFTARRREVNEKVASTSVQQYWYGHQPAKAA